MKQKDDRGERVPKKSVDGGAPTKAASGLASKKSPSTQAPKKPVGDRSLERELQDRAAKQAFAGRSLESLVDEFAPRDRLSNIDAIVSPRITDPTVRVVKGATVRKCAQCSEDVWVAPSSFAAFKGRTMPPIWCAECAMLVAEAYSKKYR